MRKSIGLLLLSAMLFMLLPSRALALQFSVLSNEAPQMGSTLTVSGEGLTDPGIVPVIYSQGSDPFTESNLHYPNTVSWTATQFSFVVGQGEGIPIFAGQNYTFNFLIYGDTVSPGLDFTIPSPPACTDTDPYNDTFLKGTATYLGTTKVDYCSGNDLIQVYCDPSDGIIDDDPNMRTTCGYGCADGVCLTAPATAPATTPTTTPITSCTDTDPENDIYKKGTVKISGELQSDKCDGSYLYQYQCKEGRVDHLEGVKCANGCLNGVCRKPATPATQPTKATSLPSGIGETLFTTLPTPLILPFEPGAGNQSGIPPLPSTKPFDDLYGAAGGNRIGDLLDLAWKTGISDYRDVSNNVWYAGPVKNATQLGIFSGDTTADGFLKGTFRPGDFVNNAESYKVILGAAGLSPLPTVDLTGLTVPEWAKGFYGRAISLHLQGTNLPPEQYATREQIACRIYDSFKSETTLAIFPSDLNSIQLPFNDVGAVKNLDCLKFVFKNGIMTGDTGASTFRPNDNINRAEFATVISRVVNNKTALSLPDCPKKENLENLWIYEVKGQPVSGKKNTVEIEASILSENSALSGVNVHLFKHELKNLSGNLYGETIKEVSVPASWSNMTLQPGRYYTVKAEIPVSASSLISRNGYKYALFTITVDLPENKILESIDVADNISTNWIVVEKETSIASTLGKVITRRQIEMNGKSTALNPNKPYLQELARYFRSLAIADLDKTTKSCVNLRPVSGALNIKQIETDKDKGAKMSVTAKIEKEGNIQMPHLEGVALYIQPKDSSKPMKRVHVWNFSDSSEFANDTGDKSPVTGTFTHEFYLDQSESDVKFVLEADPFDYISERDNTDNMASKDMTLSLPTTRINCAFDIQNNSDIWIPSLAANKKAGTADKVTIEADLHSAYGTTLTGVNVNLYRHEVKKDGGIQQLIKEVTVPSTWQNVTIAPDKYTTLKAEVTVPTNLQLMMKDKNDIGYLFTIVADRDNKIEEVDEVGNNVVTAFAPMGLAGTGGDYDSVTLEKMIAAGGSVEELKASPFSFRSWKQYLTSKYRLPLAGQKYAEMHAKCTNLQAVGSMVKPLASSDASVLKAKVEFDWRKTGYLPLPEGMKLADLRYRADSSSSYTTIHEWHNLVSNEDGTKNEITGKLTAEVEFKPKKGSTSYDFLFRLNPDNEIPESVSTDNERADTFLHKSTGKVDLFMYTDDLSVGSVRQSKTTGNPEVILNFKVRNNGTDDISKEFKLRIKDEKSADVLETVTIPYVQNGVYEGTAIVDLGNKRVMDKYAWEVTVDPDEVIVLDGDRSNNTVEFKWDAKRPGDLGTYLEIGEPRSLSDKSIIIPVSQSIYNLDDGGEWAYYENEQKFPYNDRKTYDYTVHKPLGDPSEGKYYEFITKTFHYIETWFKGYVSVRGGLIRTSCKNNCGKDAISVLKTSARINKDAFRLLYMAFTDSFKPGDIRAPKHEKIYASRQPTSENTDYWKISGSFTNDIDLKKFKFDQNLNPEGDDATYILFSFLVREWDSYQTTEDNNDNSAWWHNMTPIFLYERHAELPFEDTDNSNNYQIIKITTSGDRITGIVEISASEAYSLTKNNLSQYGDDFTMMLKKYYSGFPR